MPSDILGTEILVEGDDGKKKFEFLKGPIFNQQVLVDEINRASPRTQSALLQAMQEYEVTIGDETRKLPAPFFVIATQNPVDQAGTNSLPEAQLDRFLMKIGLSYPNLSDEMKIATYDFSNAPKAQQVLTPDEIIEISSLIKKVMMPNNVAEFAVRLAMATRPGEEYTKVESKDVKHGAGPRASQAMMKCAQAKAFMDGRLTITIDDVKAVSKQILGHRISLEYGVATPLSEFLDNIIEAVESERHTWDPTLAAKAAPASPAPAPI
jgi:MoxR-like ATPase